MTHVSRRQFLQMAGVALLTAQVSPDALLEPFGSPQPYTPQYVAGRAFQAASVYAAPDAQATLSGRLWPDSLHPLLDNVSGWYQLPQGFVRRADLQPMLLPVEAAALANPVFEPPFDAEVTGALAVVRKWCAADAPLVTRIGHGGVLHVHDRIQYGDSIWYGVSTHTEGGSLGWTQAAAWRPVEIEAAVRPHVNRLLLNRDTRTFTALSDDVPLLNAPFYGTQGHVTAVDALARVERSLVAARDARLPAWGFRVDGLQIAGAHDHNRFGEPDEAAPSGVELPIAVARWLYQHLADEVIIRVV